MDTKTQNHTASCSCCASEDHIPDPVYAHGDGHDHGPVQSGTPSIVRLFLPAIVSFALLLIGLAVDNAWLPRPSFFEYWTRFIWYAVAYVPVGGPVVLEMLQAFRKKEIFSEFTLMVLATLGAFSIGEYPEGVAVMLFYTVGENLQGLAVRRAKGNIKALLDQRPDEVTLLEAGRPRTIRAKQAAIGQILQLKPGEKLALDGELLSDRAAFNTAALTGESKPDTKITGDAVLAGMINLNTVAQVRITTAYNDSKLSKIIALVQDATAQKAPTELFIRRFAKVYTPIVVLLAVLITTLPVLFVADYVFTDWLYRALVFLVISCPCALVISIPLGYFGGIGAASRHGILFKGSNFLDALATIRQVVMDKTGTLTKGVFTVQEVFISEGFDRAEVLAWTHALERNSTHPVATAIREYAGPVDDTLRLEAVEEIAGYGLSALLDGKQLLVGNFKLLDRFGVNYDAAAGHTTQTVVAVGYDGRFAGYLTIADELKPDAAKAIGELKTMGIVPTMLSGDRTAVVREVADKLDIPQAYGDLLPEDKADKIKELKAFNYRVAFVGDGVNDAPVVALSDVGIAMGGLGSDATIETADVVIQDDMPSKIPVAIRIGKATRRIVWQNITLAFVVKAAVLILGAGGLANMWEAVFADVGVALLAIGNAIRIQRMDF
ncbi:heavy metal translocating P-type ATPase [Parapedobacter indicus]|uniref:P-type Zn(2+) transporter n=1 Tax=Parapedobacter indicus TaxID=1477437 RepID=A0A1I3QPK4_9SPHI|nr:heavy metal translocating P-type ATPase [Parapedobacter indicus]PPL00189.1 Cd2+/Zn2+-exporting ATPase [Parapedobacter indicus]SFJ35700.1 Cd2+/Zn2+-exporting ATPase [Parapedobacter indicus]